MSSESCTLLTPCITAVSIVRASAVSAAAIRACIAVKLPVWITAIRCMTRPATTAAESPIVRATSSRRAARARSIAKAASAIAGPIRKNIQRPTPLGTTWKTGSAK